MINTGSFLQPLVFRTYVSNDAGVATQIRNMLQFRNTPHINKLWHALYLWEIAKYVIWFSGLLNGHFWSASCTTINIQAGYGYLIHTSCHWINLRLWKVSWTESYSKNYCQDRVRYYTFYHVCPILVPYLNSLFNLKSTCNLLSAQVFFYWIILKPLFRSNALNW